MVLKETVELLRIMYKIGNIMVIVGVKHFVEQNPVYVVMVGRNQIKMLHVQNAYRVINLFRTPHDKNPTKRQSYVSKTNI